MVLTTTTVQIGVALRTRLSEEEACLSSARIDSQKTPPPANWKLEFSKYNISTSHPPSGRTKLRLTWNEDKNSSSNTTSISSLWEGEWGITNAYRGQWKRLLVMNHTESRIWNYDVNKKNEKHECDIQSLLTKTCGTIKINVWSNIISILGAPIVYIISQICFILKEIA